MKLQQVKFYVLGEKFSNSTGNKILIGILWENYENSIIGGLKRVL